MDDVRNDEQQLDATEENVPFAGEENDGDNSEVVASTEPTTEEAPISEPPAEQV